MITFMYSAGLLADGRERAYGAALAKVREEVQREYAAALAEAGWLRRLILRNRIDREILRRLKKIAPTAGLYLIGRGSAR
jgi:hypothetical protein